MQAATMYAHHMKGGQLNRTPAAAAAGGGGGIRKVEHAAQQVGRIGQPKVGVAVTAVVPAAAMQLELAAEADTPQGSIPWWMIVACSQASQYVPLIVHPEAERPFAPGLAVRGESSSQHQAKARLRQVCLTTAESHGTAQAAVTQALLRLPRSLLHSLDPAGAACRQRLRYLGSPDASATGPATGAALPAVELLQ